MTTPIPLVLLDRLDDTLATRSTLELLRRLDRNGRRPEMVVARHDGALAPEVAEVCPLRIVNEQAVRRPSRVLQLARLDRPAEILRSAELGRWLRGPARATYVADVGAATLLHWVPSPPPAVVAHVPAADPGALARLPEADRQLLTEAATAWIAGSAAAEAAVRAAAGDATVAVHPDLLPRALLAPGAAGPDLAARRAAIRQRLEQEHGIPAAVPLVAGIGARDWWRTGNPFVEVVWRLRQQQPDLRAVWIGRTSTDRMLWPLRHDLDHSGLSSVVTVLADDPPAMEVLAAADVCVDAEHRSTGPDSPAPPGRVFTPVVAFAEVDRPTATDDGWAVPYLDLPALVATVAAALPGGPACPPRPALATFDAAVGADLVEEQLAGWLG